MASIKRVRVISSRRRCGMRTLILLIGNPDKDVMNKFYNETALILQLFLTSFGTLIYPTLNPAVEILHAANFAIACCKFRRAFSSNASLYCL
jgi:hypothetical protein